jgi:phospholipid/cholesterol/gamma-HCH transport system substrate-binding protein
MKKVITPFRVGLLVIAAGAVLFFFLTFVKKGGMKEDESVLLHASFKDASGLTRRSRVQIAGIPVGEIGEIKLEGTHAKIFFRVKKEIGVRANASLSKRSESLLGDYMIDLAPGTDDSPLLKDGDEIVKVIDAQGMEQIFGSLTAITADIQAVTSSLRSVLGGAQGQGSLESIVANLVKLTEAVEKTVRDSAGKLDAILANVEAVSGDVRKLTSGEQKSVTNIVQNIETISRDVKDVMATVKKVVGENEGEVNGGVASLKETLAKLDRTIGNIEEVTDKVKRGEGALGALVSDQKLGQKVTDTVEDVTDLAGKLTALEVEVGVKADYLINQGSAKTFLTVRLTPKPDKYYLIEAVDDPRGSTETTYVQSNPPSTGSPVVQKQTITRESLKFSAQFAKRFSFLTLRFGIIESTGGLGVDFNVPIKFFYYSRWIEDALSLKIDAFNFSIEALRFPRLRATLRFVPFEHVYVNVGMDDILNDANRDALTNRLLSGRDFFFGAGIVFTDSDLKALLPILPVPK